MRGTPTPVPPYISTADVESPSGFGVPPLGTFDESISCPATIVVVPVYVFEPVKVRPFQPVFVRPFAPEMTPVIVPLEVA